MSQLDSVLVILLLSSISITLTRVIKATDDPDFLEHVPAKVKPVPPRVEVQNREVVTFKDQEPSELTSKDKACFQITRKEQEAGVPPEVPELLNATVTLKPWVFNDTTPFEGVEVEEEPFRKEEFKLCA